MARFRIPSTNPDILLLVKKLEEEFDKISGTRNVDLNGRRYINAGNAKDDQDLVTLRDLKAYVASITGSGKPKSIGVSTGSGSGSGGGIGFVPTVPLPNEFATVEAYAAAHPDQLANSCQRDGGTWDFMDGLVATLQAIDPRWGYNAKRGNCEDPSLDAVSYYAGPFSEMVACDPRAYVVDVISCHCGPEDGESCTPGPTWVDQTGKGGAGAGWLPTRA